MTDSSADTRIKISIDLDQPGRQIGDLQVKWSDNQRPLGYYPVPIGCIAGGDGPTVLLSAGVHGDEFEGPAALMRLLQDIEPADVNGRIIILPALNTPAVLASSRVSPLDQVNMNRAFPGDANGGPTPMLAHFIETCLLPQCDAAIDLHSGGKAAVFAPCVLTQADLSDDTQTATNTDIGKRNMALAEAFGAPFIWLSGQNNDNRSVNAAAARQGVSMVAAELGGGGGCDPLMTNFAERAVRRCLHHLGILPVAMEAEAEASRLVEFSASGHNLTAPAAGLFDRQFGLGDEVQLGDRAGLLHFVGEPSRASMELKFGASGIVLAQGNRGLVERGDSLAMIAQPVARAR
jgi:predicted deacylase